ncbi:ABC transporter ATP-binding protein [Candidatus Bathyarchaeota archaeon]|nr:MAG: ABC transporter ATP-binding protein [Candidatus Bathyarchaeota archaeon]
MPRLGSHGSGLKRSSGLDDAAILRTEGLTKTYGKGSGKTVALDNVNLKITRGKLLAVYGPSGSGKTTLLFLLGGLDKPTSGRIYFEGVEVSNMSERRLSKLRRNSFGFVFQNYNLVDELTVLENVMLTMIFEGKPDAERKDRAKELLRRVGITGKERRRPSQLSAGEQQRVAVARSVANRPELVFMDEPTGNLDQENSQQLMRMVADMVQGEGATCVVATHNLEVVNEAPSKVFLKSGRIVSS